MIFFQITYLRDRRLGNLISLNQAPVFSCCLFYYSYYFIFCFAGKWYVNPKHQGSVRVLRGAGSLIQPFQPPTMHIPFPNPTGFYYREGNPGHTMGLYSYSSCRFTWKKCLHISKDMSGLFLFPVILKEKRPGEKRFWFKIPIPYIVASNLALKSPWKDQILLYHLLQKSTLALSYLISVILTCMLIYFNRGWQRQRLCPEHDHRSAEDEDNTWEGDSILLFWVIQVCPGLPVSPRKLIFSKGNEENYRKSQIQMSNPKHN